MRKSWNFRDPKRKLLRSSPEIPSRFQSRKLEAVFWESTDFAPGVLADGAEIQKELDELLGLKEK